MRIDATLSALNHEQISEIYDWIVSTGCAQAQRRIAQSPPDGFGVKVHLTSLRRFFTAERRRRQTEALLEIRAGAALAADTDALLNEAKIHLAEAVFELAQDQPTHDSVANLSRNFFRLDSLRLKSEQLDLTRQRVQQRAQVEHQRLALVQQRHRELIRQFEFNAARMALKFFVQLQRIHEEVGIDEEAKIWKARDLFFGDGPKTECNANSSQTAANADKIES